jgi:hypothetical protein
VVYCGKKYHKTNKGEKNMRIEIIYNEEKGENSAAVYSFAGLVKQISGGFKDVSIEVYKTKPEEDIIVRT